MNYGQLTKDIVKDTTIVSLVSKDRQRDRDTIEAQQVAASFLATLHPVEDMQNNKNEATQPIFHQKKLTALLHT